MTNNPPGGCCLPLPVKDGEKSGDVRKERRHCPGLTQPIAPLEEPPSGRGFPFFLKRFGDFAHRAFPTSHLKPQTSNLTTHNPQPTTHNSQLTTHNPQPLQTPNSKLQTLHSKLTFTISSAGFGGIRRSRFSCTCGRGVPVGRRRCSPFPRRFLRCSRF